MKTAILPKAQGRLPISCGIRTKVTSPAGLRIKNVLAPIDFSERSIETLGLAAEIAKQFGATLHLAHIYEPDIPLTTVMAMPLALAPVEVARGVRRHLKDVAKKNGVELRPGFTHAVEGRPFEEICRLVRQHEIDLIVVATRGNTGLKHLLLGSTAERIVRYSPCPVLVVHPQLHDGKRALRFENILVPVDFSECSLKGLGYAKRLAKQFGSKLTVLNSVALQYYITNDEYARYDLPVLMQQEEESSRRRMRDLINKTDWEGIEVKPSLQIGHAGQQICARAAGHDADLIVTSTHGTTGFKHILVGSTAEYVVRHAPCPVLVVPSHDRPRADSKKEK
jgi:nucleotide-binding universal stress UspA family protein